MRGRILRIADFRFLVTKSGCSEPAAAGGGGGGVREGESDETSSPGYSSAAGGPAARPRCLEPETGVAPADR